MKQTIYVKAVIRKDQKVLLIKNKENLYELPGGVLDFREDPRVSLQQHLKNELGHAIDVAQLLDVFSYQESGDTQAVIILFLVSLRGLDTKIVLDETHVKYTWKGVWELQLDQIDPVAKIALELREEVTPTDRKATIKPSLVDNLTTSKVAKEVIVYTDGGSRGNPGPSAAGFVILTMEEEVLFEGGKYLGITTNNQAEYQAVKLGLEKARELGARSVRFRMDSLLIVNQMLGLYQVKNRDLWRSLIKLLLRTYEESLIKKQMRWSIRCWTNALKSGL